jgi:hypothetical protein
MVTKMADRKSNAKPLYRRIPYEVLEDFYKFCESEHRTPTGEILHIIEERRRQIMPEYTYLVTVSEGLNAWIRDECARNKTTPSAILQKIVEGYYDGLAYLDNKVERL